jgi:hemolysin D
LYLVYAARISFDRTPMQIQANLVNLSPGMAVTVEIKTGSRAVITYLLFTVVQIPAGEPAQQGNDVS